MTPSQVLSAALCFAASLSGSLALAAGRAREPAPASPAVMFRGDPAHSGVYPGAPAQFRFKWRFETRGKIHSTPAVSSGIVCFGSEDGNVYAVDAATGRLRWKYPSNGDVSASPAIADSTVYAVDGSGTLVALALQSGKPLWRFQPGKQMVFEPFAGDPRNWDLWQSSPVLDGDRLYFGSGDGALYALDRRTGKLAWKYQTSAVIRATPAVADGVVYSGGFDGKLVALDAASGKLKWSFRTEGNSFFTGEIHGSPAVADGRVFFGARDGFLYAVDTQTGKQLWRSDHKGSWVPTSPAVAGGVVFAGSSDGKFIQAVEAATGKEKWRFDSGLRVFSSPIFSDEKLIAGLTDGSIIMLNAETGKEVQRTMVQYATYSSPVIAEGVVYIGSDDSGLYAFSGSPVETYKAVAVDGATLDRYVGEYELSPMKFELAKEDGKLVMKMGGTIPLEAVSPTHFFSREKDIEIVFESGGKATFSQGGYKFPIKKTR